ncbi:MAG: GH92 family glycosyl hydrolase [Candidatus Caenarcaniphilales bacterium]|nr:GH92 family glycosyl hydrolase [Candidatus Caenarcaniphilales bacterium]
MFFQLSLTCEAKSKINIQKPQDLTKFVNPFIGTGSHGHTFPGAVLPFGMVALSPDTGTSGWDWSSGYHYSDNTILGFSHTHLSGTGIGDLGDILLMPVLGKIKWEPGTKEEPDEGYRSRFSHKKEFASPGYYSVFLDDSNVQVELTCTKRVGFHKYIFPKPSLNTGKPKIIIDLEHGISDRLIDSEIMQLDSQTIVGKRISSGWAKKQHVYFAMKFSKPFRLIKDKAVKTNQANTSASDKVIERQTKDSIAKAAVSFPDMNGQKVLVKVAISPVDWKGALSNLNSEIPGWDFERVKQKAAYTWNQELNKIQVYGSDSETKKIFYTALYHSLIHPTLFSDVDGRYRGLDNQVHKDVKNEHYTVFSLWDTFRAVHPLFTLIQPERVDDFIESLIDGYQKTDRLPVWPLWGNETGTMIGYHAVSVIAEAYLKGFKGFDIEKAYEAMKITAEREDLGLKEYKKFGYIPSDKVNWSVSRTLEYSYDDWCIAQIAKSLNKINDYEYFLKRSQSYKNLFDSKTGFMRGKNSNGSWVSNFDPLLSDHEKSDYIEGNAWQYSWFVPHQAEELIELMGGNEKFMDRLDSFFETEEKIVGKNKSADITGLIGQYAHGNEPSHHIAYLYSLAGKKDATNQRVAQILKSFYKNTPEGLIGNEDCGQLSAWYVLSAMGFYPVNPASGKYVKTKPIFQKVVINPTTSSPKLTEWKETNKEKVSN